MRKPTEYIEVQYSWYIEIVQHISVGVKRTAIWRGDVEGGVQQNKGADLEEFVGCGKYNKEETITDKANISE